MRGEPMGELYNPFLKLPKNIRQIGERDEIVKLYVEDYVNTYLKRLYPASEQDLRVGLLLGTVEMNEGTPYLFVDGAMELENVVDEGRKVVFSELSWKKAYQNVEQMFPKRTVVGWFLRGTPETELSPLNYWKQHIQYFPGTNKLMYLYSGVEGEESIYITSEDGFYKMRGYSIYYERNQMMQDYMVLRRDVKRVETDTEDKVIHEFRKRMDERKGEVTNRHQTVGLLRGMCMAMSVVILAGGIVMFNNYERLHEMESVIASVIPERAENILMGKTDTGKGEKETSVTIEEAEAGLFPTTAAQKESLSESAPEGGEGAAVPESAEASENITTSQEGVALQPEAQQPAEPKPAETIVYETGAVSADGVRYHLVRDGETLYGICLAEYHSLSKLEEVCELNGLEDQNKIVSGQKLLLP